jgi:hypothetical protein
MQPFDSRNHHRGRRSRAASARMLLGLNVWAATLLGCGGEPALETPASRQVTEALYTAVTSRRVALLDQGEARVKQLQTAGDLSPSAAERLLEICGQARREEWQPAAEALDAILRRQRPLDSH